MYEPPIRMIMSEIQSKISNEVHKRVIECGISINKPELIKALQYDRDQYDKGYKDGFEAGKRSMMRPIFRLVKRRDRK